VNIKKTTKQQQKCSHNISVHQSFAVQVSQPAQHLNNVDNAQLLSQSPKLLQSLIQRAAKSNHRHSSKQTQKNTTPHPLLPANQLHHEKDEILCLIHLQVLHNVFMVQRRQQIRLQHNSINRSLSFYNVVNKTNKSKKRYLIKI
jgi:hypothetical protein